MSLFPSDDLCNYEGGSLALPFKNIGEAGTGGGVYTKYTGNVNIFSIMQILADSWIDLMFVESAGMG